MMHQPLIYYTGALDLATPLSGELNQRNIYCLLQTIKIFVRNFAITLEAENVVDRSLDLSTIVNALYHLVISG